MTDTTSSENEIPVHAESAARVRAWIAVYRKNGFRGDDRIGCSYESAALLLSDLERLANPPTDDEREALIQALPYIEQGDYNEFADAILAAGFRRLGVVADD